MKATIQPISFIYAPQKQGFINFIAKMSQINFLKNEKSYIFADQKFR